MADFDDNDPLDDLLRDSSGKTTSGKDGNKDLKLSSSDNPLLEQPKRNRKSALMAELFGSSSSSIFNDVKNDFVKDTTSIASSNAQKIETSFKENNTFSLSGTKTDFGNEVISLDANKTKASFKESNTFSFSGTKPGFGNEVTSPNASKNEKISIEPNFSSTLLKTDEYVPSFGSKPVSFTPSPVQSKLVGSKIVSLESKETVKQQENVSTEKSSLASELLTSPKTNSQNYELPQKPKEAKTVARLTEQSNVQVPIIDFSKIENVLERLLAMISEKSDSGSNMKGFFEEVSSNLQSVSNCLKDIAEKQSKPIDSGITRNLEERLSRIEAAHESSKSENMELKLRLEKCEFLLQQHRELYDSNRKKLEYIVNQKTNELSVETRNVYSKFENKIVVLEERLAKHKTEFESRAEGVERTLLEQFERLNVADKSDKGDAVKVFHQELKWLKMWKRKLTQEREKIEKLAQEVQRRIDEFDNVFERINQMTNAVEEGRFLQQQNAQQLNQQWLKMRHKEEQLNQMKKELSKESPPKTKSSLASAIDSTMLLQMLIQQDEKLVQQQQQFISSLTNKTYKS